MFLLVPAYPGCPGSEAVKRLLLLLLFVMTIAVMKVVKFVNWVLFGLKISDPDWVSYIIRGVVYCCPIEFFTLLLICVW